MAMGWGVRMGQGWRWVETFEESEKECGMKWSGEKGTSMTF